MTDTALLDIIERYLSDHFDKEVDNLEALDIVQHIAELICLRDFPLNKNHQA